MITQPEQLRSHIELLLWYGYELVTAGQLADAWRRGGGRPPPGLAVLTFDDGWRDGLTAALPVLREMNVPATFFVCPGLFGNSDPRLGAAGVVLTESEARALHDGGMELGSHSMYHPDLRTLEDQALQEELVTSRDAVEAITGEPCRTLAYPSGWHDARVERAAAAASYELAFTFQDGPWRTHAAPRLRAPTIATAQALPQLLLAGDHRSQSAEDGASV